MKLTEEQLLLEYMRLPMSPDWDHKLPLHTLLNNAKEMVVDVTYKDDGNDSCFSGTSLLVFIGEGDGSDLWCELAVAVDGWRYVSDRSKPQEENLLSFDGEKPSTLELISYVQQNAVNRYIQEQRSLLTLTYCMDHPDNIKSMSLGKNPNGPVIVNTPGVRVNLLRLNSPTSNGRALTHYYNKQFVESLVIDKDVELPICITPDDPGKSIFDADIQKEYTVGTVGNFAYDSFTGILSGTVKIDDGGFKATYLEQAEKYAAPTLNFVPVCHYVAPDVMDIQQGTVDHHGVIIENLSAFSILTHGHTVEPKDIEIPFAPKTLDEVIKEQEKV